VPKTGHSKNFLAIFSPQKESRKMASIEIEEIRSDCNSLINDEQNRAYYARRIRENAATLDQYITSLEDTVNTLSQRLISQRSK